MAADPEIHTRGPKQSKGEVGEEPPPPAGWLRADMSVDEDIAESFPASDPPAHWTGEPPGRPPAEP